MKIKNCQYVLFDLDGTLIDSGEGIINALKYALAKNKIAVPDLAVLNSFIGPPLKQRFKECYHLSDAECDCLVACFREYYVPKGVYENCVYAGIPELLQKLKAMGKKLMVATSKPETLAYKILQQNDLFKYFDFVGGSLMDEQRTTKAEVLQYVLTENNLSAANMENAVMIGDTKYDIIGAKQFKMAAIGITYGYGSRADLLKAGADEIADSPKEILMKLKEIVNS